MGLQSFLAKQASRPSGWFGRLFAGKLLNKANGSFEDMDPEENIQEIIRTLKTGGKFYCAFRPKTDMLDNKLISSNPKIFKNLYSKSDMEEFLRRSGLKEVFVHSEEGKYIPNIIAVGTKC